MVGFLGLWFKKGRLAEVDATKKQSYFVSVKTVNLTIDEETWRASRIEAAKHNTSLSALVRGYLKAMVQGKAPIVLETDDASAEEKDRKQREELVRLFEKSNLVLGYQPSREKTYER
jgi:plasmid stability protein